MAKRKTDVGTGKIRLVKIFCRISLLLIVSIFITSCSTILEMSKYGFQMAFIVQN